MDSPHEPRWYGPLELIFLFGTFILVYVMSKNQLVAGIAAVSVWGLTIMVVNQYARKGKHLGISWRRLLDILHIWPD